VHLVVYLKRKRIQNVYFCKLLAESRVSTVRTLQVISSVDSNDTPLRFLVWGVLVSFSPATQTGGYCSSVHFHLLLRGMNRFFFS
jgi:hypothetical protein